MMPLETARQAVDAVFGRYSRVDFVHFFGGEPTLNLSAMQAAADRVLEWDEGRCLTRFGIITNGTNMQDRVLEFFCSLNMDVAVSHDGPSLVHDKQRPTASGKASSKLVERNLRRLREAGIAFDILCTYTTAHLEQGISVVALLEYFGGLGARRVSVVPAAVCPDSTMNVFSDRWLPLLTRYYRDAIARALASLKSGDEVRFSLLEEMLGFVKAGGPSPSEYCKAGDTMLTIAADGTIYPCFMFINNESFQLGHVTEGHRLGRLIRTDKLGVGEAGFACPGRDLVMSGELTPYAPYEEFKAAVRAEVVLGVASTLGLL